MLVIALAGPVAAIAHPGAQDVYGCHNDRKAGVYHCHDGEFAGQSFASKDEMLDQLQRRRSPPPEPENPVAPAPLTLAVKGIEVSGLCRVVDGDTVFADSVEVRLQGVAAPEDPNEPGGKEATAYMREICHGRQVRCELDGSKTRGREVGVCFVGGKDIGAEVIAAGLARDCPRFSKGRYRHLEKPEARDLAFPGYCTPR